SENPQLFYLDFDGAVDVEYNGPGTVKGIDVPTFVAPDWLNGQEALILSSLLSTLNNTFNAQGALFTLAQPTEIDYSTIYLGGDSSQLSEGADYYGLAEKVDVGNQD